MTRPDFAATFLQEAEELLRQVEEAALALEARPTDADLVAQLFRAFHTIKGSGGMFGFEAVVAFTHRVETALDQVREGRVAVSPALVGLVLAAKDHIEALLSGQASDEEAALAARFEALVVEATPEAANGRQGSVLAPDHASEGQPAIDPAAGAGEESYYIEFELQPAVLDVGIDPGCILRELRGLGPCTIHSGLEDPPPLSELGPNPELRWLLTLTTSQPLAAIRDAFIFVEDLATIRIERLSPGAAPPPAASSDPAGATGRANAVDQVLGASRGQGASTALEALERRGPPTGPGCSPPPVNEESRATALEPPAAFPPRPAPPPSTVRVPAERLDQLVNLVGELVINQSRLTQAFAAGIDGDMAGAVESMDRLIAELRDSVLGIRMLPIGSTFGRFQRLAHDLSVELGKEVDFVTEGGDTELDKTVIDKLGDPLVHLIRNSLDHGVEVPEERERQGKPRRGRLRLTASHEGAHVVITLEDDGRGLNVSALRAKAEAKGLIGPDAHLSQQQTLDLVFLPGLSTARQVTNISGRGVGLDVVKRTIDELRGSIRLATVPGQGTVMRLTLPLTLAIVDGLLVEVDRDRFIIPMGAVLENVELTQGERRAKNGRNLVNVRGELVPYVRLREIFEATGKEIGLEKVVIVAFNGQRLGLVVDHVLGRHQTVIQPLGRFYRSVELFSGTTIMGDGRVAIIIDVAGVVRHVDRGAWAPPGRPEGLGAAPRTRDPVALAGASG